MPSKPKILIVTAIACEYRAVRAMVDELTEVEHSAGTIYEKGSFKAEHHEWEVWIVEVGPGTQSAALEVERGAQFIKPDVALFVGVAGGIKDVKLGDVVVATKTYGFESGKSAATLLPRPNLYQAPPRLLQRAKAIARVGEWSASSENEQPAPAVHFGPVAAGDKVVSSSRSAAFKFIRKNYSDALAVEMEGLGHMLALHANQISGVVIRGISDLVDGKEATDAEGWQERAATNAAAFAFALVRKLRPEVVIRQDSIAVISWETVQSLVEVVHRSSEINFRPDVVLTMSGPGSFAACRRLTVGVRDVPLLVAVTFPRRADGTHTEECREFHRLAEEDGWLHISSSRWEVFLPSVLSKMVKGAKVLILDDRVLSGDTQFKARTLLQSIGLEVRLAALVAPSAVAPRLDFVGKIEDGDYIFPWGHKHGRIA